MVSDLVLSIKLFFFNCPCFDLVLTRTSELISYPIGYVYAIVDFYCIELVEQQTMRSKQNYKMKNSCTLGFEPTKRLPLHHRGFACWIMFKSIRVN